MPSKISSFFQQNKTLLTVIALALIAILSSIFFYKFNSIAVGYSSKMILVLGIISSLLIILFFLLYKRFSKRDDSKVLPRFYLATLLVLGLMYSAVFLPGTAPDETYHYKSAYYYSTIITGNDSDSQFVSMRSSDSDFCNEAISSSMSASMNKEHYHNILESISNSSNSEYVLSSLEKPSISGNPPQTRLFSTIGLLLCQFLNLNSFATFYIGRLFNFLWFALLAFMAYKITPVGKTLFATITFLPMTLHIVSSYSYDSTVIGLSLLLISLCLKGIYSQKMCSKKLLVAIPVVTFLLAPCKILYALSAFLVFLIPNANFPSKKIAYCYKFGLIGLILLAVALSKLPDLLWSTSTSLSAESTQSQTDYRGTEAGHFYDLSDLINDPLHTIFILVNTINQQFDFYLSTFLGGSLGWFQPELKTPWFFILLFLFILLYTARKSDEDSLIPTKKMKCFFGTLSFLMFMAISSSMLLGWTLNTEFAIEGVQGRYLLPFAPLIFLLFRTKNTQRKESYSPLILLTLFTLNTMNLIYIWAAMARI